MLVPSWSMLVSPVCAEFQHLSWSNLILEKKCDWPVESHFQIGQLCHTSRFIARRIDWLGSHLSGRGYFTNFKHIFKKDLVQPSATTSSLLLHTLVHNSFVGGWRGGGGDSSVNRSSVAHVLYNILIPVNK